MVLNYHDAFALRDNPFGPTKLLVGITDPSVMQMLVSRPLRIHVEPRLETLYSPDAGPFAEFCRRFEVLIATAGYTANPSVRGISSFILLIVGYQGTGKTTVTNVMIDMLKRCTPQGERPWHVFDPWPHRDFVTASEQGEEINRLEREITAQTGRGDYCCVLIDNLVSGADRHPLQMFDRLSVDRIVFLFMVTSDLNMLGRPHHNSRHHMTVFETRELTPTSAVAFARHRTGAYRSVALPPLTGHPLFPFDEVDLRDAVEARVFATETNGQGAITLRQLSVILNDVLLQRLVVLNQENPNFHITTLSPADVDAHIIHIPRAYRVLLAQ